MILNGSKEEDFLISIVEAKDELEHRYQSLIRSLTATASTLIGLVAVFGDIGSSGTVLRVLIICGVLSLSLTVVGGVLVCCQATQIERKVLARIVSRYAEGNCKRLNDAEGPKWYGLLLRIVPWLLCVGVLFLAAGIVVSAVSPGV